MTPFKQITEYITVKNYLYLFGNIAVFIPIPIFFFLNRVSFQRNMLFSFISIVIVEPIQLAINKITMYPNKIIDIDDFIMSLIGIIVSLIIVYIFNKINIFK